MNQEQEKTRAAQRKEIANVREDSKVEVGSISSNHGGYVAITRGNKILTICV